MPCLSPSGSKSSQTWKIRAVTRDRLEVTTEGSAEGSPQMLQLSTSFRGAGGTPPAPEAGMGAYVTSSRPSRSTLCSAWGQRAFLLLCHSTQQHGLLCWSPGLSELPC